MIRDIKEPPPAQQHRASEFQVFGGLATQGVSVAEFILGFAFFFGGRWGGGVELGFSDAMVRPGHGLWSAGHSIQEGHSLRNSKRCTAGGYSSVTICGTAWSQLWPMV